ncbi:MAG: prepilin-type N-terminal cleavage/methylation domain-containing protein [Azonexus sp.]|nr:prepilin-type N-terminal cleavage/methylation domain-containing protein [Azonexus sp.]MCK6413159.1 prepilin-type N-terminal cleavage/methylation domain-containing protein [Azonexus sp.]
MKQQTAGFSLIELAIALVVIALLLGALLPLQGARREIAARQEAQQLLEQVRDSLLGFTLAHGRLPCPAAPGGDGREDCGREHGILPWSTLALPARDPWGQSLSYYADPRFTHPVSDPLSSSIALDSNGNARIKAARDAGGDLADKLPLVVVCHGQRGGGAWRDERQIPASSGDEAENADADLIFVHRDPAPDFDDLLLWIGPAILKSRLAAVGRLS